MSHVCKRSQYQVLGCLMKNPNLLNEMNTPLDRDDFPEQFHKIIFASINNLHSDGVQNIDYITIDNFLSNYDKQYKIFSDNNGMDYIVNAVENSDLANFKYNYNRVKKFSVLRSCEEEGINVDDIYNDKIISPTKQEEMQEKFDSMSIQDLVLEMDKKILRIKERFMASAGNQGQKAGQGLRVLKENLKREPEVGAPLQNKIFNTIFRGARLKKFYMRSAPTGLGKTRFSLGDATNLAIDTIYDLEKEKWVTNGISEPVLFITTELEMDEIQTPMTAFVSGVNEDKILDGNYTPNEEARVDKAIEIIESSPIYLEYLPNFDMAEIERTIQKHVLNNDVKYVFFDYIHSSLKILEEIATSSKGMKLREDNILFIFSTKLKTLCNELGVFLMSATQVNGHYKDAKDGDESLLRGSKAIADRIDVGIIALEPTNSDLKSLESILSTRFDHEPNVVFHVYKNRRGRWVNVKVWSYADLGTCRVRDLFMTDNDYRLIPIEETTIETYVISDDESNDDPYSNIELEESEVLQDF